MLQNIKSKIFSFINTTLDKKTLLKIEKIVNILKKLEKFIKDKETNLLNKRKEIRLKFIKEFPKFKKELIKCLIVGFLVYSGFFVLHLFYCLAIDLDLPGEDIHLFMPEPMTKEEIEEAIKKIIENGGRRKR